MHGSFLDLLEDTVRRVPDKISFFSDEEQITYAQLLRAARAIGSRLSGEIAPCSAVAVLMAGRSVYTPPAFLGALYAGCAYAPLDVSLPPALLSLLLSRLSPAAVLADERGRRALEGVAFSAPILRAEEALGAEIDDKLLAERRRGASAQDPMSILCTSGSTGVPKFSVQNQLAYLLWPPFSIERYGFSERTVFGNQSPFHYANSVLEIFCSLALGASVYLLPAWGLTFPKKFVARLNERRVTELSMTPSSFVHLVNAGALGPGCLPELKCCVMSGESMPWQPLREWMQAAPAADFWHFYGSTEAFCVAAGKVDRDLVYRPGERLPVGRPFPMTHILFLDAEGWEAAPGQPGEMYISSPWVSSGYYRDRERSAESWVNDPLGRGWHERFFRTGDLGYMGKDGQLTVLGRQDHQIKHFGYRMDLGDVEAALRAVPQVRESCALHQAESGRIFCFYAGDLDEKALKKALKALLAAYMLPDVYVRLPEIPHTPNMKIDRAALSRRMEEQP